MASGRLQGNEFRSIIENAPLLANSIESYLKSTGIKGALKDWSREGMITADVIKSSTYYQYKYLEKDEAMAEAHGGRKLRY